MDAFRNKGPNSTRTYAAAFAKHLIGGVTISSFMVGITRYGQTAPDPDSMLNGAAQKNSTDFTTSDGISIPANSGVLQSIKDGIVGVNYVVTFTTLLSSGETVVWQVKLFISQYEPDPFT